MPSLRKTRPFLSFVVLALCAALSAAQPRDGGGPPPDGGPGPGGRPEGGFRRPQPGPEFRRPQAGPGFQRPRPGPGFRRPEPEDRAQSPDGGRIADERPNGPPPLKVGLVTNDPGDAEIGDLTCGSPQGEDCAPPDVQLVPIGDRRECPDCDAFGERKPKGLVIVAAGTGKVLRRYPAPKDGAWWRVGRAIRADFAPGARGFAAARQEGGARPADGGEPIEGPRERPAPASGETLTKADVAAIVQEAVKSAQKKEEAKPAEAAIASEVDAPNYKPVPENSANYAVVVGIEKYADLPAASYAERDAKAVHDHLLALGFPERNIALLTGARASKAGLAKNVETWLPNNVSEKSTVFFYYSGHGAPDVKSGSAYLVPSDGDPQYLSDTAYPVKRLYQKLGALKARRVIVAMDACFSGAGGRSVLAKGTRPLVTKVDEGVLPSDGKIVSLSASAPDETSGTADKEGHGLFTYYLLSGLNGAAAGKDGRVTVGRLYQYLAPRVSDAARRENRAQTPQLLPAPAAGDSVSLR